jgi:hypothetical protein
MSVTEYMHIDIFFSFVLRMMTDEQTQANNSENVLLNVKRKSQFVHLSPKQGRPPKRLLLSSVSKLKKVQAKRKIDV